jgi:hypothetical protein
MMATRKKREEPARKEPADSAIEEPLRDLTKEKGL